MPLPLPNVLYDVGPGGRFVTAAKGGNALSNEMALRRYNEAKAEYAPESLLAQAASQTAYANNVGPQYIAKILQDAGFKGNTSDPVLRELVNRVQNAGLSNNPMINALNLRMAQRYGQKNQQNHNPLSWLWHQITNKLSPQQQNMNPVANMDQQPMPQQGGNAFNQPSPQPQPQNQAQEKPGDYVDQNGNSVTDVTPEQAASLEAFNKGEAPRSYQQNEGEYEGGIKQGGEAGKFRAQDVHEIGKQNQALSAASTNLDAIINDANDPGFESMRAKIPGFQKKQLSALKVLGTPEEKEKIGKFIADIRQYAAATVNSFRGPATGREFTFANDLKPTEDDTIEAIRGKARSLKELNKIAYQKNFLVSTLMDTRSKHPMNLTDAVESANKAIDISKIQKDVYRLVHPQKEATQEDIKHMSEKYNKSPEEIKKLLKSKGIKYGR